MASCVIFPDAASHQQPFSILPFLCARAAEEENAWGLDLMIGLGDGWT